MASKSSRSGSIRSSQTRPDGGDRVQIGTLGRAHGVHGESRFFPDNPESDFLTVGTRVCARRRGGDIDLTVARVRQTPKFDILAFDEVSDRDAAEALTNLDLSIAADDLPETDDDEYYHGDLVGLGVAILESPDGPSRSIGEVAGFFPTGANDVMVVRLTDDQRVFVPMIDGAVAEINVQAGILLQPEDQWAPEGADLW